MGAGVFETVSAEVDLGPGGRYELLLEPGSMRLGGEFREVTPPQRLVYTFRWLEGVPDTRESLVTVEFRDPGGGRTEVARSWSPNSNPSVWSETRAEPAESSGLASHAGRAIPW